MEKYLPNHLGTLISDYSNTKLTQKVNSFLIYLQWIWNLKHTMAFILVPK